MAIYQASASAGICLSRAVSGFCLDFFGYRWLFVFTIGLHLLSLFFVISIHQDRAEEGGDGRMEIFQKMKALFRSRRNNAVVWLMLASSVVISVTNTAESNLYLYYLQEGFNFTVVGAGVYTAFRLILGIVSTTALSPILSNWLKWSDFRIGSLSAAMTLASTSAMAFAKTVLHLIIFALMDFLKIFVFTLPMTIVSKCVKGDEIGVFVSLRFIAECLFPIVTFYVYDLIFSATSQKMPGAFFLASASVYLLVLICFCVCHCVYKEPESEPLERHLIADEEDDVREEDEAEKN